MRIVVSSVLRVYDLTDEQRQRLVGEWSVDNPEYLSALKGGRWVPHWMPKKLYAGLAWPDGHVELPRGLLEQVEEMYPDAATAYDFAAEFCPNCVGLYPERLTGCTLRPYQERAVDALCEFVHGVLVGPCGSGKTTMGIEVIRRFGVRTLVLVHTKDLLDQWNGAIAALLGEWGKSNVTVCTVQSLWATAARTAKPLPDHGMLIVDENHHVPARCFADLVGRSTARYRYGLTATPARGDGLGPVIEWTFGPIRHTVDRAEVEAAGQVVLPRYEIVRTGFSPEVPTVWNRVKGAGQLDYTALVTMLASNVDRSLIACSLAKREASRGHVVLILTTRVEHAEFMADMIDADGEQPCHVVHGKVNAKVRTLMLEDVRQGKVRILVATQIADEGLDLPILDRLIIALPGKSEGKTMQRIGRIMRPAPGKTDCVVYDLVDDCGVLWGQQKARKRAFEKACGR